MCVSQSQNILTQCDRIRDERDTENKLFCVGRAWATGGALCMCRRARQEFCGERLLG